tara:strand:- start:1308 stop:1532 length:225 start_codon:yes stop_codon:yes gene_type:complete
MQKLVNNELVTLTEEEEAALIAQSALPDTTPYDKKRRMEYPSIEECVHAILDDGLSALQEKRAAIKAKYPKVVS